MGSSTQLGTLSSAESMALGVLPAPALHDVPIVRGSYDVTLSPLAGSGGTKVLRLSSPAGNYTYVLEYRAPVGTDSWLGSAANTRGVQSGVLLRELGVYSTVVDTSPSEDTQWASDRQFALTPGTSTRLGTQIHITVRSMTAAQAVVRVVVDEPAFPRDLDGDRVADLIVAGPDGVLYKYPATTSGPWGPGEIGPRVVIGRGWQTRDLSTVAGGWQGTGVPEDVLARDRANGDLWMYPRNGHGGLSAGRVIGHGWQVMTALFSPGDWDGDGNADLVARRNDGTLFLYPGDGHGGFLGRRAVGHGWQSFRALTGVGDWNQDGYPDVLALTSTYDGAIDIYYGYGIGGPPLMGWTELGHAWNGYRVAS